MAGPKPSTEPAQIKKTKPVKETEPVHEGEPVTGSEGVTDTKTDRATPCVSRIISFLKFLS